ncbi:Disrupted in schizophrenia 1 protein [Sciurus carolinensis]|uniref:Disrupted in schizophrenia 1 protein n=1 Tax=Sciurus carolinensis TaxID=30640 RepID=A0AA41N0Z4_SCICA|nr:Disrupted in schizophrenia 1 protein [Sciurus carolinensis]
MRSAAGSGTRVLSPAVSTPPRDLGGVSREELRHSEPRAGQCSLDQSGQWPGPLGSSVPKSSRAPAVSPAGHLSPALTSVGGTPVCFGIQPRPGRRFPERPARLSDPADAGGQQESFSMDGSAAPGAGQDASLSAGAGGAGAPGRLGAVAGSGGSRSLGRGLAAPQASPGSHETFTSSFSFIRLSLGSAGERGEAEGCLPSREAETSPQSPQEIGARATNPDGPHEDPQGLSQPFCLPAAWGVADSAQGAGRSSRPECGVLPSSDVDAGCSSSPDPSLTGCGGSEGSGSGDAHGWDALLQRWEPVLRDRLLSTRRQLEVASLRSKLQKLQEAAVEEEDYDKAEVLKQRLEDLEQEAGGLQLALPSRQPALRSFLSHLAAQAQAALRGAPQASGDDTQAPRSGEPATPGGLHVTAMRWDRLFGERQQLQKEMAALQARMSVLEAQDQRLSRELEEQERRGLWQRCGLTGPAGQLQAISKALQDTLAAASQLHAQVEPPEAITSLQERIKSLNLSLKEVTNEVCTRESLCSSLRRRVSHLETRLPALREARVLAVSGGHFCTAKDLAEEIRALGCEREGLEAALGRLLVLGSGSAGKLGRLREDQDRLRRELARQAAAHEASVKEKAVKYVEVLEENLRSDATSQRPHHLGTELADFRECAVHVGLHEDGDQEGGNRTRRPNSNRTFQQQLSLGWSTAVQQCQVQAGAMNGLHCNQRTGEAGGYQLRAGNTRYPSLAWSEPMPGKRECRVGQYVVDVASFEQLALPILRNVGSCGGLGPRVCVIDEIGKMELFSQPFIQAVRQTLSSPATVVLGTIPAPKGKPLALVEEIRGRPDVKVFSLGESKKSVPRTSDPDLRALTRVPRAAREKQRLTRPTDVRAEVPVGSGPRVGAAARHPGNSVQVETPQGHGESAVRRSSCTLGRRLKLLRSCLTGLSSHFLSGPVAGVKRDPSRGAQSLEFVPLEVVLVLLVDSEFTAS